MWENGGIDGKKLFYFSIYSTPRNPLLETQSAFVGITFWGKGLHPSATSEEKMRLEEFFGGGNGRGGHLC